MILTDRVEVMIRAGNERKYYVEAGYLKEFAQARYPIRITVPPEALPPNSKHKVVAECSCKATEFVAMQYYNRLTTKDRAYQCRSCRR